MGKSQQNLQEQQSDEGQNSSSGPVCRGCSMVFNRIAKEFSFRCIFVLILSLSVFLSGIFWILPHIATKSGFDAKEAIKLSATVQANFRLEKPVMDLVPHIERLEYDINGEVGVPGTKVAILSMHQFDASNWTDVVFGVLSDPINVPIIPVSLSVLRSSLVELFLKQSNLTVTASIFGQPSMFEIRKFPGGITVFPEQSALIWQMPQILFNFTLNNSVTDIVDNFVELKEQLRLGLRLRSNENILLQITNKNGSTIEPTVVVQASLSGIVPLRLKQLAQTITGSPAKNLGLDHSVFGKVKSISLSSYQKGTPAATPPTPSPAPSPEPSISPYAASPVFSPEPSPDIHHLPPAPSKAHAHPRPCTHRKTRIPPSSSPTSRYNPSAAPTAAPTAPPTYAPNVSPYSPSMSPSSQLPPHVSPTSVVPYAPSPENKGSPQDLMSPSPAPSMSSLAVRPSYKEIRYLALSGGLFFFHLLRWLF